MSIFGRRESLLLLLSEYGTTQQGVGSRLRHDVRSLNESRTPFAEFVGYRRRRYVRGRNVGSPYVIVRLSAPSCPVSGTNLLHSAYSGHGGGWNVSTPSFRAPLLTFGRSPRILL